MQILALGACVWAAGAVASAAPPPGCVADLRDVHTQTGGAPFASHYVTAGTFGYGEFKAGSFGGQSLWRRQGAAWCRMETGATVLDRAALIGFGVPPPVADRLLALMKGSGELAPPVVPLPPRPPGSGTKHR